MWRPLHFFAVLCLLGAHFAVQAQDRPNVLWLSWEDSSARLGCYGDAVARTPHLDGLAAKGVRFTNAFANAPVCAPCRSAIITGQYASTIGSHHMRCRTALPSWVQPFPKLLREAGYYCTNHIKEDYQLPAEQLKDIWSEPSAKKAHWRNRPDPKQPFFAVFNDTITHEGQFHRLDDTPPVAGAPDFIDPARVEIPPYWPDTPKVRECLAQRYRRMSKMDTAVGERLKELQADGLAEDTIIFCWGDHGDGMPRAKRWLYDSGLRVPLIAFIPDKWRQKLGCDSFKSGGKDNRLVLLFDLAATTLNLCGVKIPAVMQAQAFYGPNLKPARSYIVATRDRMDEWYDHLRGVSDGRFKYIRHYQPWHAPIEPLFYAEKHVIMQEIRRLQSDGNLPAAVSAWLQPTQPQEEFFDTQADPHELTNLLAPGQTRHPEAEDALVRLKGNLSTWQKASRDLGALPETLLAEIEASGTRQADILRQSADPSAKIQELLAEAEQSPTVWTGRLARCRAAAQLGKAQEIIPELIEALACKQRAVATTACDIIAIYRLYDPRIIEKLQSLKAADAPSKGEDYPVRMASNILKAAGK